MSQFILKERYYVIKVKDAYKHLTREEREVLKKLQEKTNFGRFSEGKDPLECVCVEKTWGIYEKVWELVEQERSVQNLKKNHSPKFV